MHVLVTGGAGYIGSHMTALLLQEGFQVTVLDSLEKGYREAVSDGATFVRGNCGDARLLAEIFREASIDAVMHFAAYIEAGESMEDPGRFLVNNTARTLVLLDAMLKAGVRKLVFSSTAAIFGNPEYTPIDEEHPKHPTNVYGQSKLMVEAALGWLHQLQGLEFAALRYFNAAGCSGGLGEDHRPETHLLPLALDAALGRRGALRIFGTDYPTPDGTCIRDFIHVEDIARAHILALRALSSRPLIYNLGNGHGHSVREVIETAQRVTGLPIPVVEGPRRPGDPVRLVASSAKIRRELGWEPRYPDLQTIIESAWNWRRVHAPAESTPGS